MGVSVVICCYNSARRIPTTLQHLAKQRIPAGFSWEILLVNNASTDETVACAKATWSKYSSLPVEFRIIDEPKAGQMHARKRGANEAKYEYLVFCDDDNWLAPDYIFLAEQMMNRDPMIGAGGGQNSPVTDADAYPEWFEEYKDKYALGIPAAESGDVTWKGFVLGAGLVTRRSLFLKVNDERYPSLLTGRDGENLSTGDDFEYCKRILLWGYKLYYDAEMKLEHFIPKERLTIAYRDRLMQGILEAGKVLHEYDHALWLHNRNKRKNKWRLLLLSPFRVLFATLGLSKRKALDEQLTFYYLAPFNMKTDPARALIKRFLHHQ